MPHRRISFYLLVSLLLHLVGLSYLDWLRREEVDAEILRVRLLQPRKFVDPQRLTAARPTLAQVQMERLASEGAPQLLRDEVVVPGPEPIDPDVASLSEYAEEKLKPEFEQSIDEGESFFAAWRQVYVDTLESETMDLLRLGDINRDSCHPSDLLFLLRFSHRLSGRG